MTNTAWSTSSTTVHFSSRNSGTTTEVHNAQVKSMTAIVTIGIDLGKNVFAVHGVDATGKPALVGR
jgi:hypothetical protein